MSNLDGKKVSDRKEGGVEVSSACRDRWGQRRDLVHKVYPFLRSSSS